MNAEHEHAPSSEAATQDDTQPMRTLARAASYARRSAVKEEGIILQHDTNAGRAQTDGYEIPPDVRWSDDGVSGTSTQRGGLDSLLKLISSGRATFTRLYVRERDRLARTEDPRFATYLEYHCKIHGVQICYSLDKEHPAYDGADPQFAAQYVMASMQTVQAHQELRTIRQRTTRGTRDGLKKGKYVAGGPAPFGYNKWLVDDATKAFVQAVADGQRLRMAGHHFRLRIDPTERVVVEQIFAGIRALKTYAEIARELHDAGAPRCGANEWSGNAVRKIARNPLHMGDYVSGRLRYRGQATVPAAEIDPEQPTGRPVRLARFIEDPIVSTEIWESVQQIMDARIASESMRKASTARYLLTGLVRCASCGDAMVGHRQGERKGRRVHSYRHNQQLRAAQRAQPQCPHVDRYLRAEPLEAAALAAMHQVLSSDEAEQLVSAELLQLRESAGAAHHAAALEQAEAALLVARRAAKAANVRAAHAVTPEERTIHDETMRELAAESQKLVGRVDALRAEAGRLAEVEARLPRMQERRGALSDAVERGTAEERKRAVATVVLSLRVDFIANTVELRVRAA